MNIRRIVRELRSAGYECEVCALEDDAAFIELERLADETPEPDWSQIEDWVQWWTVDANGTVGHFESEPILSRDITPNMWVWEERGKWAKDLEPRIDIPIGVDWRTLKRRRPRQLSTQTETQHDHSN